MYVCLCNAITEKSIQIAIENGATNLRDLMTLLGVGDNCGGCVEHATDILVRAKPMVQMHHPLTKLDQSRSHQGEY